MNQILNTLAIPMNPIQAYSPTHFGLVVIIFTSAILLAWMLKRTQISHTTVVASAEVILIILEVLKQFLLTYVRGGSYSWSDFPFQLCSIPMYLCVIYCLSKRSRIVIEKFLMTYGLLGAIFAFAIPYSSFYHYLLLTIQSLAWHGILIFLAIYLIWDNNDEILTGKLVDFLPVWTLYLLVAVIAVILNITLKDVSGGSCNMFFFGPGHPDVGILDVIMAKAGWIVETAAMILCTEAGAYLVYAAASFFRKKICIR